MSDRGELNEATAELAEMRIERAELYAMLIRLVQHCEYALASGDCTTEIEHTVAEARAFVGTRDRITTSSPVSTPLTGRASSEEPCYCHECWPTR